MPRFSADRPLASLEEYLRLEQTSATRHEFHDGEVLAMSGGTLDHSTIATNLTAGLRALLRNRPCRVNDSNLRVATESTGRFVYPDATVFCGEPRFHAGDPHRTTLVNPRVVFEVLSPSTEAYDRGEKFRQYRAIGGFEEYVLISSTEPLVESHLRGTPEAWDHKAWTGLDTTARVRCLELDLPLRELYENVGFSPG